MNRHTPPTRPVERAPSRTHGLIAAIAVVVFLTATPRRAAADAAYTVLADAVRQHATERRLELTRFAALARRGIAKAHPHERIADVRALAVAPLSSGLPKALQGYLDAVYADMRESLGETWTLDTVEEWRSKGSTIALLHWSTDSDGGSSQRESVAVFDPDNAVMFDTELARHAIATVTVDAPDERLAIEPDGFAAGDCRPRCQDLDTDRLSETRRVDGVFGSVEMTWTVSARLECPRYLTQVNSGEQTSYQVSVSASRQNASGIPPIGAPVVYFGSNGEILGEAFESDLTITNGYFVSGAYDLYGSEDAGANWGVSLGVSVGPLSVEPVPPSNEPLGLQNVSGSRNRLTITNRVFAQGLVYRGAFGDGGTIGLTNFLIRSSDTGSSESGGVSVRMPVQVGFNGAGVIQRLAGELGTLRTSVQFVRGDRLVDPTFQMSSLRDSIANGEETIIQVRVRNESSVVALEGGSVSIDAGTLEGHLVPTAPLSQSIGVIEANRSAAFNFTFVGGTPGIVVPQARVSSLGWASPVPTNILFENTVSLDTVSIAVGQPGTSGPTSFERGDANADGEVDLTDSISSLNFLFLGGDIPDCLDAADSDDSGELDITDSVFLLNFLFLGGDPPAAPFATCGPDRTLDLIDCAISPCVDAGSTDPIVYLSMDEILDDGIDRRVPNELGEGNDAFLLRGGPSPKPEYTQDRFDSEGDAFEGALEFFTNPGDLNSVLTLGHVDIVDTFTLSLWVYFGEGGGRKHLIGERGWMSLSVPQSRNGTVFEIETPEGETITVSSSTPVPVYEWHLFTVTVDYDGADSIITIYRDDTVDADPVRVAGVRFGTLTEKEMTIGALLNCRDDAPLGPTDCRLSWYGLRGRVDDVRIYDRAVDSSEVGDLFRENGWSGN